MAIEKKYEVIVEETSVVCYLVRTTSKEKAAEIYESEGVPFKREMAGQKVTDVVIVQEITEEEDPEEEG